LVDLLVVLRIPDRSKISRRKRHPELRKMERRKSNPDCFGSVESSVWRKTHFWLEDVGLTEVRGRARSRVRARVYPVVRRKLGRVMNKLRPTHDEDNLNPENKKTWIRKSKVSITWFRTQYFYLQTDTLDETSNR